jgi:hypothetical protein
MNTYEQTEHDQVIAARGKQLGVFYRVLADPDVIRNRYSNDVYPDIIVIDRKNNVVFIEEIESESSVTDNERNHRWASYSELGYPFNLIVPKSKELEAKNLIKGLNIHKLYYYELTVVGIRFRQVII